MGDFMYRKLYDLIEEHQTIYLYRHVSSDMDALGSQLGLRMLIKDNFKDKTVICMGLPNPSLMERMGDSYDLYEGELQVGALNIVLDTANHERIDGVMVGPCVKVDHHEVVDSYGFLNIEDSKASSTCELMVDFYLENKDRLILTKDAAALFYFGIVSDSNRFMYENVSSHTLHNAAVLLDAGIDKQAIYNAMYLRTHKDLIVQRYILNHYHFEDGFAYFILDQEDLDALDITREEGSLFVNVLSNIEEIQVWASITYQNDAAVYRISLRSRDIPVEPIARQYGGGGHRLASGCRIGCLDELPGLIQKVKEAINYE